MQCLLGWSGLFFVIFFFFFNLILLPTKVPQMFLPKVFVFVAGVADFKAFGLSIFLLIGSSARNTRSIL